jgi:hypothetical protein
MAVTYVNWSTLAAALVSAQRNSRGGVYEFESKGKSRELGNESMGRDHYRCDAGDGVRLRHLDGEELGLTIGRVRNWAQQHKYSSGLAQRFGMLPPQIC